MATYMLHERECGDYMSRKGLLKRDFFVVVMYVVKLWMDGSDKEIFQYAHCHRRYSIRQGSFWSGSKLPLTLLLLFFLQG